MLLQKCWPLFYIRVYLMNIYEENLYLYIKEIVFFVSKTKTVKLKIKCNTCIIGDLRIKDLVWKLVTMDIKKIIIPGSSIYLSEYQYWNKNYCLVTTARCIYSSLKILESSTASPSMNAFKWTVFYILLKNKNASVLLLNNSNTKNNNYLLICFNIIFSLDFSIQMWHHFSIDYTSSLLFSFIFFIYI